MESFPNRKNILVSAIWGNFKLEMYVQINLTKKQITTIELIYIE